MSSPARARVLAAMRGGVDSSVAAALAARAGHDVTGVTLDLWSPSTGAAEVAAAIGIPHVVLDARALFMAEVVSRARDDYAAGMTPNPCIVCNDRVKFGFLIDWATRGGFDVLVTGHHAEVVRGGPACGPRGEPFCGLALHRGRDPSKDQSYVLYRLVANGRLDRVWFPVGGMTKREVRDRARAMGLPGADRRDSQDLCFPIADPGRDSEGPVVDRTGRVLGTHRGLSGYTVGQRRGLGIPGKDRAYVVAIRPDRNEVVVGDADDLLARRVIADLVVWDGRTPVDAAMPVLAKVRYRQDAVPGSARIDGGLLVVDLERRVRAITPGQALVCYEGDRVLGGGTIRAADQPGRSMSTSGGTRK